MNLAFDFDAPAAGAPNPARTAWAEAQLDAALSTNKTGLKALKADPVRLLQVIDAIVLITRAKAEAMTAARAGRLPPAVEASFNWIGKRPAMAAASLALSAASIADSDLSALPSNLT